MDLRSYYDQFIFLSSDPHVSDGYSVLWGCLSIPELIYIVLITLSVKQISVSDRAHSQFLFLLVNFVVVAIFGHFSSINFRLNVSNSVKNLLGFKLEMH